jgi:hypothetical protein
VFPHSPADARVLRRCHAAMLHVTEGVVIGQVCTSVGPVDRRPPVLTFPADAVSEHAKCLARGSPPRARGRRARPIPRSGGGPDGGEHPHSDHRAQADHDGVRGGPGAEPAGSACRVAEVAPGIAIGVDGAAPSHGGRPMAWRCHSPAGSR